MLCAAGIKMNESAVDVGCKDDLFIAIAILAPNFILIFTPHDILTENLPI
jgi:hypothetical protein